MEKFIKDCGDCPLCSFDMEFGFYCGHPNFEDKYMPIERDFEGYFVNPSFCPLNQDPLMLKKRRWQTFENFWLKEN